ncbi:related to endoglucanase I precursor [Phialocephala subalpina]|uniref:Related to endoglucanase I n=1 Tax=Phialocephala subalpina TaxID=576137 RepID=A0A1L7WVT4_9HELO|nr:related to endoglucanase I precursor [Phialocephala subalpina]
MHFQHRSFLALAALSSTAPVLALPTFFQLVPRAQASVDLCGDYDYIILQNSPWIVYNMLYNAAEMVGTQCTYYDEMTTSSSGTQEVLWNSETDIEYVESTSNVPKGYSFVGLTQNLEVTLSSIGSIPTTYDWTRTNTTAFKGNVCYDFMTNDIKGDSTSTSSRELMLWLQYEGGQLPIGWGNGPSATIDDLFGTSWELYEDVNTDTGITVSSLLPTTQFEGSFSGDLKDWLLALVALGKFTEDTYVNVGNAGTEFFYGNATMNATLALQIDIGSTTTTSTKALAVSTKAASATSSKATFASTSIEKVLSTSSALSVSTPVSAPVSTSTSSATPKTTSKSSSAPVSVPTSAPSLAVSTPSSTPASDASVSVSAPAFKTHQRPSHTPKPTSSSTRQAVPPTATAAAEGRVEEDDSC